MYTVCIYIYFRSYLYMKAKCFESMEYFPCHIEIRALRVSLRKKRALRIQFICKSREIQCTCSRSIFSKQGQLKPKIDMKSAKINEVVRQNLKWENTKKLNTFYKSLPLPKWFLEGKPRRYIHHYSPINKIRFTMTKCSVSGIGDSFGLLMLEGMWIQILLFNLTLQGTNIKGTSSSKVPWDGIF